MEEQYYEKLLNIMTCGEQKWDSKSTHYHPYEPTSYSALEVLFHQYRVDSNDHIIDFGCGKGRLIFYINHFFKCEVTGIEMNNEFYEEALNNKASYLKNHRRSEDKINFLSCFAQDYKIKPIDNKFYFFNPFSIKIFIKVIENILDSVEIHNRTVQLILYYPSDDYVYYLENSTSFVLIYEVMLPHISKYNSNERFLIYQLKYI